MPKVLASLGILTLMIALGASDALLIEGGLPKPVLPDEPYAQTESSASSEVSSVLIGDASSAETSSTSSIGGVKKAMGPDVLLTLTRLGFEIERSSELTILRTVIPEGAAEVHTYALLLNGDRAGLIAWTESAEVKNYFLALKEALHASFSPRVKDLLDETQHIPGKPPRNFLSFLDEGLSPERLVFLRVRERLYEIRITEGNDEAIFRAVDELTQ